MEPFVQGIAERTIEIAIEGVESRHALARTIHAYLLRRPTLSPGVAFLVRPPRRTARTPRSALLARSPGVLRSRTPREGIQE
jgi:hypothetical protein